jgi:hypothetical protein
MKATHGRAQADIDHLAAREAVELLVPLRSKARSGERTLAHAGVTSFELGDRVEHAEEAPWLRDALQLAGLVEAHSRRPVATASTYEAGESPVHSA